MGLLTSAGDNVLATPRDAESSRKEAHMIQGQILPGQDGPVGARTWSSRRLAGQFSPSRHGLNTQHQLQVAEQLIAP
jgi:hypothetical protein